MVHEVDLRRGTKVHENDVYDERRNLRKDTTAGSKFINFFNINIKFVPSFKRKHSQFMVKYWKIQDPIASPFSSSRFTARILITIHGMLFLQITNHEARIIANHGSRKYPCPPLTST
jgi:hypothetical protein